MQEVGHEVEPALQPSILEVVVVYVLGHSRADDQVVVQAVEMATQLSFLGKAADSH